MVIAAALALVGALAAPAAARPDLQVRAISTPSTQEAPGGRMTVSTTVRNAGNRTARSSRVGFYLSLDRRKSRGDFRLRPRALLRARRPRTRARLLRTLTVPSGIPAGRSYALIACADDTRRVRESRERNNCRSARRRLPIVPRRGSAPAPPGVPPAGLDPRLFQAPSIALTGPPNGTVTSDATPSYSGTATSPGTRIARVEAKVDAGGFSTAGVSCAGCGTPSASWSFTAAALPDGPHAISFRAIDVFGRGSPILTRTITVDTTPPTFASITATPASTSVTASFSEALACVTVNPFDFTAEINNLPVVVNNASCTGSTVTLTLASAPGAGQTVEVTLTEAGIISDAAGNVVPHPTTRSDVAG